MHTRRFAGIVIAAVLIVALGGVVAFAATRGGRSGADGWQMMREPYGYQPATPTPARTLSAARSDAQQFATRLGLRVDETMQFERNFYAKLVDSNGHGATEVLVDPATGNVSIEYGPAMMWNTRYGMGPSTGSMMGSYGRGMMGGHGNSGMMGDRSGASGSSGGYGQGMMGDSGSTAGMVVGSGPAGSTIATTPSTTTSVSLSDARTLAQRWLDSNEPGVKVETGGDAFPGYYTLETLKNGNIIGMISVNATSGAVFPHWWHGAFIAKSQ